MTYDLIIFDCDGTLVDTESMYNEGVSILLTGLGFEGYTPAVCRERFTGYGMNRAVAEVERETGRALPRDFVARYEALANERMAAGIIVLDGVHETLALLSGKVRMCVGSNGERSNVLTSLLHARLSDLFHEGLVFTKDMVARGKPAPDLFLHAAQTMGAHPERVLVVEDSVTGVLAGKAAGMTVAGITAAAHDRVAQERALRNAGAEHIIERFSLVSGIAGFGEAPARAAGFVR